MPVDPITFEIVRHRLFRVVEEAVITLKHVSGSAITNEGHDLMVSLYTADGGLLMGGVGFLHQGGTCWAPCGSPCSALRQEGTKFGAMAFAGSGAFAFSRPAKPESGAKPVACR